MSAYDVMAGQAGNRVIVRWRQLEANVIKVSHFESAEEFLTLNGDDCEWYQINDGPRIDNTHKPLVTKTGKVLTDADIQALADEAERGYDVEHLKAAPSRRPVPRTENP